MQHDHHTQKSYYRCWLMTASTNNSLPALTLSQEIPLAEHFWQRKLSHFRLSGMSSTARDDCGAQKAEEGLTLFHVENLIFSMASAVTKKILSEADVDLVVMWGNFFPPHTQEWRWGGAVFLLGWIHTLQEM